MMFKFAFVLLAGAGIVGGATFVATRGDASPSSPSASTATAVTPELAATRAAPLAAIIPPPVGGRAASVLPPRAPSPAPTAAGEECDPPPDGEACDPDGIAITDDGEILDPASIERAGLYRGPSRGPADAPVQIAVYQDLKCKYCAMVLGTIDQLWDEYPGQLRLVVKQFPVHDNARLAAEASLAADAQGKFWELHDRALAFSDDLSRDALIELARDSKLDVAAFTRALDDHSYADAVARDVAAGHELNVQGTPAFFINGRRFTGAQPIEAFRKAIDAALAARK